MITRKPSIHITENKLYELLKDYLWDGELINEELAENEAINIRDYLMSKAKFHSLDKRSVTISNDKLAREINKKTDNNKIGTLELSNIIYTVRKSLKHKGISMIKQNSPEYNALKKLRTIIEQFANDWEMDLREASIFYVKKGLSKISSYRNYIGKLCDMSESISMEYEAKSIIDSDESKSETERAYKVYIGIINTKTGIAPNYRDNPIKYLPFIQVKNLCNQYSVTPEIYIQAQFEGLAWTDAYPEPNQLVSEKAIERLNKYVYTKKINLGKVQKDKPNNDLTNILKRIKDGDDNN